VTHKELTAEGYRIDWGNATWLAALHIAAMATLVAMAHESFATPAYIIGLVWWWLSNTAIGAGYHRFFSHPTHKARWPVQIFYLLLGGGSFQGPARRWADQHRAHHAFSDEARDPYSVRRGFWWAHLWWIVYRSPYAKQWHKSLDLSQSRLVLWQERFYIRVAVFGGLVLPTLVGWYFGCPWQTLLVAGPLRIAVQLHQVGCVNSIAHWFGEQTSLLSSARNGSWWLAVLGFGENARHADHHLHQNNYRIDPDWFGFDPGKWFIETASTLGLAYDLH